jgi:hypothetical protein
MKTNEIVVGRFYTLKDGTLVRVAAKKESTPAGYTRPFVEFQVYEQTGNGYYVKARDIKAQTSGPTPEQPS